MIVILKQNPDKSQLEGFTEWLKSKDIEIHTSVGFHRTILGLVGDTSALDTDLIASLDIVEDVKRIQEPYKAANRKFHPENTVINVGAAVIGGGDLTLIAGPCSVESEKQICAIAESVKKSGATLLRGGAFKPRTSPYSFQGMGPDGIALLKKAREVTGLPFVTEITDASFLPYYEDVDVLQVGARNMQNFELLKALGKTDKPVLLKRGMSATYEELLMSAEYIMSEGNEKVILCERGVRTFESYTRNMLDIAAVPALKQLTHLPVIVDPSHATGRWSLIEPLCYSAAAAGADGLIVEVHVDPVHAVSDGPQSIKPELFERIASKAVRISSLAHE